MPEVIDFPKPEDGPHIAATAVCGACLHEWAAVAPVGHTHLECPKCKRRWGTMKHPIEPTGPAWRCYCGEELFWLLPDGPMCRRCGVMPKDWL